MLKEFALLVAVGLSIDHPTESACQLASVVAMASATGLVGKSSLMTTAGSTNQQRSQIDKQPRNSFTQHRHINGFGHKRIGPKLTQSCSRERVIM